MLDCFITRPVQGMIAIQTLMKSTFEAWYAGQDAYSKQWVKVNRFTAEPGTVCLVPNQKGQLAVVLVGMASLNDFWVFGDLPLRLPDGQYHTDFIEPRAMIAWGLGSYTFTRYKKKNPDLAVGKPQLLIPSAANPELCTTLVESTYWVRDLINTPTEDMSPFVLSEAAVELAKSFGSSAAVIVGDELLEADYPTIHAVGRGSTRPPRLVDFHWGDKNAPSVTLVGKGICFDSGGLNLKTGDSMRYMKKDMAGVAHVLGLARIIMTRQLPVRLRVILPMAENMVAGNSYRPGDVITTRAGISVEITNTDAEGRLVLCDALSAAVEESPNLLIDFSTLTGAARVALGPDVAAFFANQENLATGLSEAGKNSDDPLWRLPLYQPYERYLKSEVADICNAASGGFAGAITAALYLKQFIPNNIPWAHFDIGAWNYDRLPGRPVGGEANALRAVYNYLENQYRRA